MSSLFFEKLFGPFDITESVERMEVELAYLLLPPSPNAKDDPFPNICTLFIELVSRTSTTFCNEV